MLLPKLLSVDLQNALAIIIVFHTAPLWLKELFSQQKKCGNGPTFMDSTGLTVIPTVPKQLA